jgi:hypothetical protein
MTGPQDLSPFTARPQKAPPQGAISMVTLSIL